jgi:hypothetical protein
MQSLCPGYFEREVQEIIEREGCKFCKYFCALCGRPVEPRKKEGDGCRRITYPSNLRTESTNALEKVGSPRRIGEPRNRIT